MLNSVNIIGALKHIDDHDPRIRYLFVERSYSIPSFDLEKDLIPIVNWNKEPKGEIFIFPNSTLVAIRGRIEMLNEKLVIVVETITNLGLKY